MEAVRITITPLPFSPPLLSPPPFRLNKTSLFFPAKNSFKICCKHSENETEPKQGGVSIGGGGSKTDEYNTAMKKLMMNPYEYHHEFG